MGTWADLSNFYFGPGFGCNRGSCRAAAAAVSGRGNATDSIYPSSPFSFGGAKAIGAQRGSGRSSGRKERIPVGQRASKFARRRRRRRRVSRSRPEISRGIQIKPSSPLLPPRCGRGVEPPVRPRWSRNPESSPPLALFVPINKQEGGRMGRGQFWAVKRAGGEWGLFDGLMEPSILLLPSRRRRQQSAISFFLTRGSSYEQRIVCMQVVPSIFAADRGGRGFKLEPPPPLRLLRLSAGPPFRRRPR